MTFTVSYKIGMHRDSLHPLREWRRVTGKTLVDVAAEVEVTPSHLSEIERGLSEPSLSLASRLAKLAGIPIESFVKQIEAAG